MRARYAIGGVLVAALLALPASAVAGQGGQVASQDCQADLADFGETDFIDLYGDEPTDSLDYAMAECVAEGVDEILNSDDDVEDDTEAE